MNPTTFAGSDPSPPSSVVPKQYTPVLVTAQVWLSPAVMLLTVVPAGKVTSTGVEFGAAIPAGMAGGKPKPSIVVVVVVGEGGTSVRPVAPLSPFPQQYALSVLVVMHTCRPPAETVFACTPEGRLTFTGG
jgi:hypothetical protein